MSIHDKNAPSAHPTKVFPLVNIEVSRLNDGTHHQTQLSKEAHDSDDPPQMYRCEKMLGCLQGGRYISYKWGYSPYEWPYKWVTGVIPPINLEDHTKKHGQNMLY